MIDSFLQIGPAINSTSDYIPIVLQLIFSLVFVGGLFFFAFRLKGHRNNADKLIALEDDVKPQENNGHPEAMKHFILPTLFVLFIVEIVALFPYAVYFKELGWNGFVAMVLFVAVISMALLYVCKKGGLHWEE